MMNKMHCSSNSKSLWNDPASRSRRAFSTVLPNRTTWGNQAKSDKIESECLVLVSLNGHKRDISYDYEKAFFIGMNNSPLNRKSSSAIGSQIIRIGSERKEFTNGTTGEACLAKPSVERLPKALTLVAAHSLY